MPTALLSAYDTTFLDTFAQFLLKLDWEVHATSPAAEWLESKSVQVTKVHDETVRALASEDGVSVFRPPLCISDGDGVVTIPSTASFTPVDLVYVNLAPLDLLTTRPDYSLDAVLDIFRINSLAMILAGVKAKQMVLTDPGDLREIVIDIQDGDWKSKPLRCRYGLKVLDAIGRYLQPLRASLEQVARQPT